MTGKTTESNIVFCTLHAGIIVAFRQNPSSAELAEFSDLKILRIIFSDFRAGSGTETRGKRLTHQGLEILRTLYQSFEFKMPEEFKVTVFHLRYLSGATRFPYFLTADRIIVFDSDLAFKIRLSDNHIGLI
jgi:hypothetical protein